MTENENQKAPILICGMHRSGTSMVAQALARCGLYLGKDDELMEAHIEDNPDGFWEYNKLIKFSDQLLNRLGGSWDNPDPFQTIHWLENINFEEEQQKALLILEPLMKTENIWGWKDPRATVMLPFWQSIFPNIKVIICLRNPMEVAYSLSKRHTAHVDFDRGLTLWRDYHEILNRDFQDVKSVVTHYEAMLFAPEKELERLFEFINISPSLEERNKALTAIKIDLHRGVFPEELLFHYKDLPLGMLEYYEQYSNLAGKNFSAIKQNSLNNQERTIMALNKTLSTSVNTFDQYNQLIQSLRTQVKEQVSDLNKLKKSKENLTSQLNQRENSIQNLTSQLNQRENSIQNLTSQLNQRENSIQNLTSQLNNSNKAVQNLTSQLEDHKKLKQNLTSQIRERDKDIQNFINQLQESEQEILYYVHSKSWRITRPLRKFMKLLIRK